MDRNQVFAKYIHDSDVPSEVGMHSHSNGQLSYVHKGVVQLRSPSKAWVVPEERVVWIPPDQPHSVRSEKASGSWKIMLPRSFAALLPQEVSVLRTSKLLVAALESLPEIGTQAASERIALLAEVIRQELLSSEAETFGIRLPTSETFRELTEVLLAHPEEPRDIDEWAASVGMSRRTFTRHFQAETGSSFGDWKRNLVLARSLELLAAGSSVGDIADCLGYASPSAFIAAFRKKYGSSPLQYLKT